MFGETIPTEVWLFVLLIALWSIPWKGFALWRSARRGDKWWFIALLVINTLGLLEIVYIFAFSNREKGKDQKE